MKNKIKKVKWFKEGDSIPLNSNLIKTERREKLVRPPEGGDRILVYTDYFLYEYLEEQDD